MINKAQDFNHQVINSPLDIVDNSGDNLGELSRLGAVMGQHVQSEGVDFTGHLPGWVPADAAHYIVHTEKGAPIRVLARAAGCHASTILRQIRKIEQRRDDPLIDAAIRRLGHFMGQARTTTVFSGLKKAQLMTSKPSHKIPDEATLAREAMRVLRRLCEPGALLAVAADMDKAVVVRNGARQASTRTAVVEAELAQAMALKEWISPANSGRIVRYHITNAGRNALSDFLEQFGMKATSKGGFAEAPTPFHFDGPQAAKDDDEDADGARSRYAVGESPLNALARRRDKSGKPFLSDDLVRAGERLREDFELAQMDSSVAQNWDHFLTPGTQAGGSSRAEPPGSSAEARARVKAALDHLGVGLSDIVLRCCCYLEGLETTEKRLGWSARSGKIVLRIALIRLKRHYDETVGPGGPMIG